MSTFKFQQQTGYTGQTGNALQQSPLSNAFQAAGMLSEAIDQRAERLRNANRVAETTRVLNDIETATAGIWEEFSVKRSIDHKTAQERLQKQFAKIDASIQDKHVRDRVSANMKGEQDRFALKLDTQEWKFTVNRGISELDKFMLNGGNKFIKAQDETESLKILSSVKQRYYEAVGAGYIDPDKADSQWEQWRGNLWYQKLEEDVSIDPAITEKRFNSGYYDIDSEKRDDAKSLIAREIERKEVDIYNGYIADMKSGKTFDSFPGIRDETKVKNLHAANDEYVKFRKAEAKANNYKAFQSALFQQRDNLASHEMLMKQIVSAEKGGMIDGAQAWSLISSLDSMQNREEAERERAEADRFSLAKSRIDLGQDVDVEGLGLSETSTNILRAYSISKKEQQADAIERKRDKIANDLRIDILAGNPVNIDPNIIGNTNATFLTTLQKDFSEGNISKEEQEDYRYALESIESGERYTNEELDNLFTNETLKLSVKNTQNKFDKQLTSEQQQEKRTSFKQSLLDKTLDGTLTPEFVKEGVVEGTKDKWLDPDEGRSLIGQFSLTNKDISFLAKVHQGSILDPQEANTFMDQTLGMDPSETFKNYISRTSTVSPRDRDKSISDIKHIVEMGKRVPEKITSFFSEIGRGNMSPEFASYVGDLTKSLKDDPATAVQFNQDVAKENEDSIAAIDEFNSQRSMGIQDREAWANAIETVFADPKIAAEREKKFDEDFENPLEGGFISNTVLNLLDKIKFPFRGMYFTAPDLTVNKTPEMMADLENEARKAYKRRPDMNYALKTGVDYVSMNYAKSKFSDGYMKYAPETYFKDEKYLNEFYNVVYENISDKKLPVIGLASTNPFYPGDLLGQITGSSALGLTPIKYTLRPIESTVGHKLPDYEIWNSRDGLLEPVLDDNRNVYVIKGNQTLEEIEERLFKK